LHPIVSVTSLGPNARHISGEAHFEGFGYDSPWGRLHRSNAKLMTMGMGHYPEMGLTFLHYIEHAYGVPYQYVKLYSAPVFAGGSRVTGAFTMSVRYLDFGITYDTNRFKNDLVSAGCARIVPLATNSIFLTTAEQAMDIGIRKLRSDRYYFLKEPPRFRPGELPADGTTGDLQYVYDRAISAE
jgi:aminoglycoside 3-N-acetyltransferase